MARRSVLFAPGNDLDKMRKATASAADLVVFDLEDAVVPNEKEEARKMIKRALTERPSSSRVAVRVNPRGEGMIHDLDAALSESHPDCVMLPKTRSPEDVDELADLISDRSATIPILALIETAAGVLAAARIAEADHTDALLFGAEDLAADIGATRTPEATEVLYARQHVVIAAAAAGVDAIDTIYPHFTDLAGLRTDSERAVQFGYDGKMVIHPDQIDIVNEAFSPTQERIDWAERVISAARETDAGVFEVDGEMIDAPLIAQAERILERSDSER